MTNIIRFPHGRQVLSPILDELTALEIEIARARLAQIRSETRQGNALWFWYCFKRVLFWGCVLWVWTTIVK